MANSKIQVLVFDDQTQNSQHQILGLLRDAKVLRLLADFFRRCSHALINEISALNGAERNQFPKFNTINELVESYYQLCSHDDVICGVLLCLTQLGCFIRYMETTLHVYPCSNTVYIGLCTGLLSAAAIASSTSLSHLLTLAADVVCVCFKVGLTARRRAQQLESENCLRDSWSILVANISPGEARSLIETFQKEQNIVPNKQAYVSTEAVSSVTISGPPSTLKLLFSKSKALASSSHIPIPIRAAYHAGHLGFVDTKSITDNISYLNGHLGNGKIHSTRNGKCFSVSNLQDLLVQIVEDILVEPLKWNHILAEINIQIKSIKCAEIDILPFGPSKAYKHLAESLRKTGVTINIKNTDEVRSAISHCHRSENIAIVGMSGRFPGGEDLEEFWKTLIDGLDLHKQIPTDRFDVKTHCDPTGAVRNSTLTPYGCFIDRPGVFDATLFNMSPREADQTDPQQRLTLITTYEALEMAGYVPNRTPSTNTRKIGTFFGQTCDDWREVNASQNVDIYFITGGTRAFGPGRLNYYFKWEGPSYSIDTACSSSAAAVQLAYSALMNYECDTAVAGGTNILTAPDPFAGLSRANFLSMTGSCKTFDDEADGYCRSDAIGCVVMKRLEDAITDNDNVLCVMTAAVTNHSAEAVSITHPHVETQQRLYRILLNNAAVQPNDINYIEMHGTGTQAGDMCEIRSVISVFSNNRDSKTPLFIGSVKPNVGHSESAAGITSIIKATLMLQNNTIPPHVGIKKRINSKFPPLDTLNVHIPKHATEFKRHVDKQKRRIVINNFDAAGGNTAILIEDAPARVIKGVDPRTVHVVTVSAKTPFSFKENAKRLLTYIKKHPESSIGDISYTTTARRMHHMFRAAYTVSLSSELESSLEELIASPAAPFRTSAADVAFVFTGQGSHYLTMGKELFDNCSTFRRDILEYDNLCQTHGFPSFKALIDGSAESLEMLSDIQTQLALVALELALANLWLCLGVKPVVVVGHSLGEYAALCVANVLSVNDALFLVGKRASLMSSICSQDTHAMLAVMLSAAAVKEDLSESNTSCEIACFNGPQSTIISGCISEIAALKTFYASKGIKTTTLETPIAFHSSQLDPILKDFQTIAESVSFCKPTIPVASTLLGSIAYQEGIFTAEYLCRHARDPVKFADAIEACRTTGIADDQTVWLEIGPNAVCLSMVKSILNVSELTALQSLKKVEPSLVAIARCIAKLYVNGLDVNWMAYHREYESSHQLLALPTYAFDMKNYWIQYEGDWCLRKNMASSSSLAQQSATTPFGTTSLQRIESEEFTSDGVSVVFVSDIGDSKLRDVIQGHLVNKIAICPASVYTDMAFTAAKYIYNRCNRSTSTVSMDIRDMKIVQPLIQKNSFDKQFIYVFATRKADSDTVELTFTSEEGSTKKQHASCIVRYGDGGVWMAEWSKQAYLIQSRMDHLVEAAVYGKSHRLLRGIVYKLFSVLVQYSKKYRGIAEVWMDSNMLEATANIKFQTTTDDGSFECSPYWIDSICHLSGFVLHGTDTMHDDFVYIAHGWKSMRIVGHLSADKSYKNYVRMQPIDDGHKMIGDVYVFEEGKVIAVCAGLQFQRLHRSILEHILVSNVDETVAQRLQIASDGKKSSQSYVNSSLAADSNTFVFEEILEIIGKEIGVKKSKLHDDVNLADLGVDSLLTISILTRLRQLTNLDIPSTLFYTHSTVGDLRQFIGGDQSNAIKGSDSPHKLSNHNCFLSSATSQTAPDMFACCSMDEIVHSIRSIIASEIGCSEGKILPSTVLADLGIDNRMSLLITSLIRSKTGLNISETFFRGQFTFLEVMNQLRLTSEGHTSGSTHSLKAQTVASPKQSTSILLQGSPTSLQSLFLFPDGSGSAGSYMALSMFDNGMAVYGLNSPFLDCPSEFTCTMEEVAEIFLAEVRRRQPSGPYILGGWSSGGLLAYEAATQLIASGQKVLGLIFIDSLCPLTLPPLPFESIDFFDSIGVFGDVRKSSSNVRAPLRQHFTATIITLRHYIPKPMNLPTAPKTCIFWAKEGILESISHEHITIDRDESFNKTKAWLLETRKDHSSGGWEKLIPCVEFKAIAGNHFTIMRQPQASILAKEMEQAVMKFAKVN